MLLLFHRRKGLAFVDLNTPYVINKKVTRNSKWECGAVEWNPHLSHAHIFANAVSIIYRRLQSWTKLVETNAIGKRAYF